MLAGHMMAPKTKGITARLGARGWGEQNENENRAGQAPREFFA